jgi:regulator of replication initiation timing
MSWWRRRNADPLLGITTRLADLAMQVGWIAALREQTAGLKRENAALRDEMKSLREQAQEAMRLANAAGEACNKVGEVAVATRQQLAALLNTGRGDELREQMLRDEDLADSNPGVLV